MRDLPPADAFSPVATPSTRNPIETAAKPPFHATAATRGFDLCHPPLTIRADRGV
jgi:hypothetical protein